MATWTSDVINFNNVDEHGYTKWYVLPPIVRNNTNISIKFLCDEDYAGEIKYDFRVTMVNYNPEISDYPYTRLLEGVHSTDKPINFWSGIDSIKFYLYNKSTNGIPKRFRFVVEYDDSSKIILFYTYEKRNQFSKYSLNYLDTATGIFRENVNITEPEFDIEFVNYPDTLNYVWISSLKRFYFIDTITLVRNNLYRIKCHCDVLMSFMDDVLNSKVIAVRSETDYDGRLIDNKLPAVYKTSRTVVFGSSTLSHIAAKNCFVVQVMGYSNTYNEFTGGVRRTYITNHQGVQAIMKVVMTYKWTDDLRLLFNDISNGILSIKVCPFSWEDDVKNFKLVEANTFIVGKTNILSNIITELGELGKIYDFDVSTDDDYTTQQTFPYIYCGDISFKNHLNLADFLTLPPYTKYQIYIPYVGLVDFNPVNMKGTELSLVYLLDFFGSDCVALLVEKSDYDYCIEHLTTPFGIGIDYLVPRALAKYSCNLSIDIPIGSSNANELARNRLIGYLKAGISLASIVATYGASSGKIAASSMTEGAKVATKSALKTATIVSATNTVAECTTDTITNLVTDVNISNVDGNFSNWLLGTNFYMFVQKIEYQYPEFYEELIGKPSNKGGYIGDFNGLLVAGSLNLRAIKNATNEEMNMIDELLRSGVVVLNQRKF